MAAVTTERPRRKRRKKMDGWGLAGWIFLVLLMIFAMLPMIWMLITSLKLPREIYRVPSLWPEVFPWDNYHTLIYEKEFLVNMKNSLIVATTAAHRPYLLASHIRPGTHVTAMGSDTPDKNEVEPELLRRADRVVADSKAQCLVRGEIHQAIRAGAIDEGTVVELGSVIAGTAEGRTGEAQITIADLTGVAVQDIMIAKAVVAKLAAGSNPR